MLEPSCNFDSSQKSSMFLQSHFFLYGKTMKYLSRYSRYKTSQNKESQHRKRSENLNMKGRGWGEKRNSADRPQQFEVRFC